MQELVKSHQEVRPKSDAELFQEVSNGAKDIYRAINSADPALMRSSRQYREMKQEADRLRKLTQSVTKKIQEGGKPKAEETAEMLTSLGILSAKTAEYLDYKLDQVQGDEKRLNNTEKKRVAAARTAGSLAGSLIDSFRKSEPARQQQINAQRNINQWIGTIQNEIDVPGKSLEEVQTLAATMIYMKAMNISDQKLGNKIITALAPEARNQAVEQIKQDLGFKAFAKQGTDKLIAM